MNNLTILAHLVSSATTANALLYILHKASFTFTTFLLYRFLPPAAFAQLATIQSIIFLMVLWLDCGLRKAIPRYAPLFHALRDQLIMPLILLQLSLLLCALPLLMYILLHTTTTYLIIFLSVGIYLAEGTTAILRSLYHAYFHHRPFNYYAALCIFFETFITIGIIGCMPWLTPSTLIPLFLCSKLLSPLLLTMITIIKWPTTSKSHPLPITNTTIDYSAQRTSFIKHAACMWGTTILTSISERNFLVPCIMHISGITIGNSFKIAHDSALFFYRCIIKTIGSTDTALLAHVHTTYMHESTSHEQKILMEQSVQILSTQIARLALPFLGIIMILVPIGYWFYHDYLVFHAFLIMAIGYILETIIIPYERVLEVQQNYKILSIIYSIYTIAIALVFTFFYMTWIGFSIFLISIQSVRLVIGILMRYSVYRIYGI